MEQIKNIGSWILKNTVMVACIILALWLWDQYRDYKKGSITEQVVTKTKEVEKLPEFKPTGPINVPTTIINQIHLDSSFWRHAQQGTIITGIKQSPGEVDVQKVDSNGRRSEEIHKIKEGSTITIGKDGTVTENKASFLSQLKLYAGGEIGMNQNGFNNLSPQIILTSPTGWALNGSYNIMDNSKNIGLSKIIRLKKK